MINPSINGWINKFFVKNQSFYQNLEKDWLSFYHEIRNCGFIYGHVTHVPFDATFETKNLSQEEITKLTLLHSLYTVFGIATKEFNEEDFKEKAKEFYTFFNERSNSIFLKSKPTLEDFIANRVQTNENIFAKNFSHIITNALLFMDVLAFKKYLEIYDNPVNYLKKIEESSILLVTNALLVKENPTQYDELLQKLFQNSLRYTKFYHKKLESKDFEQFSQYEAIIEKLYLLDLVAMTIWSDDSITPEEQDYLHTLCIELHLPEIEYHESLETINQFITKNKAEIPYFNYSNPIKHFYDQSNKNVTKLITRNSNRLVKEIRESKELMILLAKSTHNELDADEKKKVKKQLLDVCKTIPSLTIFLLPGGGLLLPILIKYIPQLLPSAFNENLED